MKKSSVSALLVFCVIVLLTIFFFLRPQTSNTAPTKTQEQILTLLWAKWAPADYLQKLTEDFTRETGITIKVFQEPWGSLQDRFFKEARKKSQCMFDMVVGDSQWLGSCATEGHYTELTKWITMHGIDKSMTPASVVGYSEYPSQSGHYWAVPAEGDALGFAYRKDLFQNPEEKQKFKEKYGYELDVPQTWHQIKDIAEHFYRPEEDFYGIIIWRESHYDGLTMGVDTLLWAWGAGLGNPKTYKVKGILNSEEGINALKFYKTLCSYSNKDWQHLYIDSNANSNTPIMEGKVAMAMVYFAITPELMDKTKNPYADKIGFFASPKGPEGRATSLGGQGLSIVSYSKKKDMAFKFIEWFVKDDVQRKWARLGGLSCNKKVLYSEEFLSASPLNRPFVESMEMVRDFWTVPEYADLLKISQKYWSDYVIHDKISAKDAMDNIAREWEDLFESKGYYKE